MPAPLIAQGSLNRLKASIVIPLFPELNVTPSYLGKGGISLSLETPATLQIDTMTGAVTSPEPYQRVALVAHLVKSQPLADLYKQQFEANTQLGQLIIYPDADQLSVYQLVNCSLMNVGAMAFDGTDAMFHRHDLRLL